ncbi:cell cycle checkpoint control protein RAD9A-like isoform X2 [Pomacea canaliculata]|uniref:cell cycle checkpoint control protein RAD9A-like isoform X2 n=1 Tax=Pomacea canaliculata TaxID=400727 RepID=UPI000D733874|nr:cell cycle checkpoint control protein RAD9A-like isoform X2 [Pomacea canaliculata]
MKCTIPGVNLKVFGRAIHSLSKIGEELYIEPLEQGLALKTVNSSRSAYACFLFFPSYFQHYDDGSRHGTGDTDENNLRCKLTMKSILTVFKSLSSIEKSVEQCKISHNASEARLVFQLYCRHGIVKTHNLAYTECETLQAIYSKDACPNKLTAPAKLLCEVVVNFQNTQEEVTLCVQPDSISLKNYVDDEPDPAKVVHTELSLMPEEFDRYQIGVNTDITFCLKELRAILAFGETTGLPLNIHFESAGRPITFCIDSDQTFEASFVLATLIETDQGSSQQQQPASTSKKNSKTSVPHQAKSAARPNTKSFSLSTKRKSSSSHNHHKTREDDCRLSTSHKQPMDQEATDSMLAEVSTFLEDEWEEEESNLGNKITGSCPAFEKNDSSPVIPLQITSLTSKPRQDCLQPLEEEDGNEDLNDTIPGTPPAKKFRALFFGSSQTSTQSQQKTAPVVLAADTDEED